MNLETKKFVGTTGEKTAEDYLIKSGYRLIRKNYREKFDEIDLIMESKNRGLVFVEVKTLIYENKILKEKMTPEDNFTEFKFKKIKRICEMFSAKHKKMINEKTGWHIDLITISIIKNDKKIILKHYKDI